MLFERAKGIVEQVKVTPVNVSGREYVAFVASDGKSRLMLRDHPRLSLVNKKEASYIDLTLARNALLRLGIY